MAWASTKELNPVRNEGGVVYATVMEGDVAIAVANAKATAFSAASARRPLNNSNTNVHPTKINHATRISLQERVTSVNLTSVTGGTYKIIGVYGNSLVEGSVHLRDLGDITVTWPNSVSPGLDNTVNDGTYFYSNVTDEINVRGAVYVLVIPIESAASAYSSGSGQIHETRVIATN